MSPGGGGGEHGCKAQGHPPATGRRGRAEDAPPHPPPPFPATNVSLEMKKKQKQEHEQQSVAMGTLPVDALVEILSRVPYKSLCRFKCVSKPWLALCSDPKVRKRCPQTLSGFFFNKSKCGLSFCNLSGRGTPMVDPSLPFLRRRTNPNVGKIYVLIKAKDNEAAMKRLKNKVEDTELFRCLQ
ncbi:hypothetical protein ACQ4PT_049673 [Festuca glaucescens]